MSRRVFFLSPANCGGERAQLLFSPRATFDLACRLREPGGAPLGEVMSFVSGLYFRGKLTYAARFGVPLVITPHAGLRPPDDPVTLARLRAAARVDIHPENPRYRRPLRVSARAVADVGQQDRGHDGVIAEEVALRDALVGPEDFPEVRQLDGAPPDVDLGVVDVARDLHGRGDARRRRGTRALRGVMVARRGTARRGGRASGRRGGPAGGSAARHQRARSSRGGRGPWRTAPTTGT